MTTACTADHCACVTGGELGVALSGGGARGLARSAAPITVRAGGNHPGAVVELGGFNLAQAVVKVNVMPYIPFGPSHPGPIMLEPPIIPPPPIIAGVAHAPPIRSTQDW